MSAALPPLPTPYQEALTPFWAYTAKQMTDYASQARADLEAENKRLREALDEIAINTHDDTAERVARAALKEQP